MVSNEAKDIILAKHKNWSKGENKPTEQVKPRTDERNLYSVRQEVLALCSKGAFTKAIEIVNANADYITLNQSTAWLQQVFAARELFMDKQK